MKLRMHADARCGMMESNVPALRGVALMRRRWITASIVALIIFVVWFVNYLPNDPEAAHQQGYEDGQRFGEALGNLILSPLFWVIVFVGIVALMVSRRKGPSL